MMKPSILLLSLLAAALAYGFPASGFAADSDEVVVVALGDSLTAGYGLPQDQSFPAQLEAALRAKGNAVRVMNAGVSGDTASSALKRLDWALPDDTDAVIVELGGNDALQGLPPEAMKASLTAIVEAIQDRGLPVLLAGMEAPRNLGAEYVSAFSAVYTDIAAAHDVLLYPFFLDGAALNPEFMQPDGIHPNGKGVAVVVKNILPKVEALLSQVRN